jgi:hypothetical protein
MVIRKQKCDFLENGSNCFNYILVVHVDQLQSNWFQVYMNGVVINDVSNYGSDISACISELLLLSIWNKSYIFV